MNIEKIKRCADLLPPPGGQVVKELCEELESVLGEREYDKGTVKELCEELESVLKEREADKWMVKELSKEIKDILEAGRLLWKQVNDIVSIDQINRIEKACGGSIEYFKENTTCIMCKHSHGEQVVECSNGQSISRSDSGN